MRILADENIPFAKEAFSCFGEVTTVPGRSITREQLADIDTVLVRTVTRVDAALLEGTTVQFVGTATSGLDHIDTGYLASRGVRFAHAQGANASSVAEYVLAAILEHTTDDSPLDSLSCAIIGLGHVGRAVYQLLAPLGIRCVAVDPFINPPGNGPELVTLQQASQCDILTFHTPLTTDGDHPTHHMIDAELLSSLNDDALIINAARGAVADSAALLAAKQQLILDVFEGEPDIDPGLVCVCKIATPHIAGYSLDSKVEGTRPLFHALNDFRGSEHSFPESVDLPLPPRLALEPPGSTLSPIAELRHAIRQVYDIRIDDRALRDGIASHEGNIAQVFDTLRKSYWPRREFTAVRFNPNDWSTGTAANLRALGFNTES